MSYERLLVPHIDVFNTSILLRGDLGYFYAADLSTVTSDFVENYFALGLTTLHGTGKTKLELNIGYGYFDDISFDSDIRPRDRFDFTGVVGIRYKKPNKNYFIRTGIGFPDWVYLSLGYAF